MASSGWLRGKVKAVPSGDTLVIMGAPKDDSIPPEKSITLSSIVAPRLARRPGTDEPFAWESREFLRKLCIGKDVTFRVDYVLPTTGREFGTVYVGEQNVACLIVANGFAKVKEHGQKVNESLVAELLRLENSAKQHGLGCWTKEPKDDSIRSLSALSLGEINAKDYIAKNKGKALEAIVEQVRDGSTLRVCFLPSFDFVQVYVAGVQAPSIGRRAIIPRSPARTGVAGGDDVNGESSESSTPIVSVIPPAINSEISPDKFGREAKHFTETRVLNREVRIVLVGTDSFNNMFGSVYFSDGGVAKDLALELVENGYAKYMERTANMLGGEMKTKLKNADLHAKKEQLRIWTGFKPPVTNTRPIHSQKFTGRVVEIVNGTCIIVADDVAPLGSPLAERRINLSSIRPAKMDNHSIIEHFARAVKEFLRTRLIGKQVTISMDYSRRINIMDSHAVEHKTNTKILDYGSVFLPFEVEGVGSPNGSTGNPLGINIAELLLSRGFVDITRHRDYEERSCHYDSLLAAYSRAEKAKKGYHSKKDYPVTHMNDLTNVPAKKAREFLHLLQRNMRHTAIVEYVFSGHRLKLTIPKEGITIAFSFSGVRCPGKNEPYSNDAISFMRGNILQRDVEIQIDTMDKTGTFLGYLWKSNTNMASVLLERGLAKLNTNVLSKQPDVQTLMRAEQCAKMKKLKVWENYNEAEVIHQGLLHGQKKTDSLKVSVTEVLGGGKFYAQIVGDCQLVSIQQQLAYMEFLYPSKTFISESPPNTPLDTFKDQDKKNTLSSDTLKVKDTLKDNPVDQENTLSSDTLKVKDTLKDNAVQDQENTLSSGTLKDNAVQDQENTLSSNTLKVNPKDNAVPLPSRWALLFKDQQESSKDDVTSDNPEVKAQIDTFEANDHSDAAPFKPVKGDVVLARFSLDNSWNRAMIVSEHQGAVEPEFLVYYIDYGNQEFVPYSRLKHADDSISSIPPRAKLCSLAFITVPNLDDDLGEQAAEYLSGLLLHNQREFIATIEERCNGGAKMEGQGTGEVLMVTLVDGDVDTEISINGAMLERGLAQIERKKSAPWGRTAVVKNLENFEERARKGHRVIWRHLDEPKKSTEGASRHLVVDDVNEDEYLESLPARAPAPSRGFDLIKYIASKSQRSKAQ